ncbi:MAG: hypothetical protein ACRDK5_01505 [Solirubrobacterales bacterium]
METRAGEMKPSGPVAAVLLAAAVGALVLAALTIWAEASESFADSLAYDLEVGPLSGKTIWATTGFLASWGVLTAVLRRRDVGLGRVAIVVAALVGLALVGTFAPFFQLFAPE